MKKITHPNSLYIHIPFCLHLCDYCDFTKMFYLRPFVNPYIKEVVKQINSLKEKKFKTIYVGGGTPTSLNEKNLELLLSSLECHLKKNYEFTLEVNVETMTLKKLEIIKRHRVNRISIGVQSFNDTLLKSMNRLHSKRQVIYWIKKFYSEGIENISIDLIYGFQNQTLIDFENDLKLALTLPITHISSYSLTISKGTVFYNNKYKEQDDDKSRLFYDSMYKILKSNGFQRYEISNFCRNDKYSRHNMTYWLHQEYIGLGLGAHGFENNVRYQNNRNITKYLKSMYIDFEEELSQIQNIEEYIMLNLRLDKGINKDAFKNRFSKDFDCLFEKSIQKNVSNKLLKNNKKSIKTTYAGSLLLDQILLDFFNELS